MDKVRFLIANISHHLLADIIQKTAEVRAEIEVIGHMNNRKNLLDILAKYNVGALVIGMWDEFKIY